MPPGPQKPTVQTLLAAKKSGQSVTESTKEKPLKQKRTHSDVAEDSVENVELLNIHTDLDEIKKSLQGTVTKADLDNALDCLVKQKDLKEIVTSIVNQLLISFNENIRKEFDEKIRERTGKLHDKIDGLAIENEDLRERIRAKDKTIEILEEKDGINKIWDAMEVHDSVAVLIYNVTRNVLVFVKQFRPAIYLQRSKVTVENGQKVIKHEENPATLGITFELCAGIRDKEASLEELAQAEVLEECGYKVPLEKFEKFCSARAGVGTTGALMTMFYVEVTDDMKVSQGGGIVEEGEFIDVVDIPVSEAMNFAMDESINKPVAMMMGVLWFFQNKHKQSNL